MFPRSQKSLLTLMLLAIFASTPALAEPVKPINLPATFVPEASDFADESPRGVFSGITSLRIRALKPVDDVRAVYVVSAPNNLKGDPFQVGDVLYGLSGEALGSDPTFAFRMAVEVASRYNVDASINRWRKGENSVVTYGAEKPQAPDLTNGGQPNLEQEDWNLGTTGAEGWTWSIPHKTTEGSKQIYITQIEEGSPAAGVLNIGDVITGAFGEPFTRDARKEFASALTRAESNAEAGKLRLTVWNDGKTRDATLQLKVMGDYGQKSPFDSEKNERIVDAVCAHLLKRGLNKGSITAPIDALGLLSTGREDVMPLVREQVEKIKATYPSDGTWTSAYSLLLLTEYHLATKDPSVLDAIKGWAIHLARGQSQVGTWGHRICIPYQFTGDTLYGVAPGYGAMNQPTLTALIALALTEKCGVRNPDVKQAIQRGQRFYRSFVDRGAIPYGDHNANPGDHDDNGKNSIAAVFFDLIGDKEAATFFTRMSIASHNDREGGHTGNYWSFLWGPLGAARAGDEAAAAFHQKMTWFYDLERTRDGSFEYQGKPGMGNKAGSEHAYKGWDTTGARLLAYTLPRKKLYITGKGRTIDDITGAELAATVDAGELSERDYIHLPTSELLKKLGNWSPTVRRRAAQVLEAKPENIVDELIAMFGSDNRYARYGAVEGLRFAGRGSEAAADKILAAAQASDDPMLKFYVLDAFSSYNAKMGLANASNKAAQVLMQMLRDGKLDDPKGSMKERLSHAMFYSGNAERYRAFARSGEGVENMDSDLLVHTVRELLKNKNGGARSTVSIVYDHLNEAQLKELWPDIYRATRELAPSGIMFASGVREAGINLMAKHHAREGMELAAWYISNQKFHGSDGGTKFCLKVLVEQYGGHAKAVLPELEKAAQYWSPDGLAGQEPSAPGILAMIREGIAAIEKAETPNWELTSIAEYLE